MLKKQIAKKQRPYQFNPLEQIAEFGVNTVRKAGQGMVDIMSPGSAVETSKDQSTEFIEGKTAQQMEQGKNNQKSHTPLNFASLDSSYKKNDAIGLDQLRNTYFHTVKQGEKQVWEDKKQEMIQKQHEEEQQKKQIKQDEQNKKQNQPAESHGKQKLKLGQARKKAVVEYTHVEKRASAGQ